MIKKFLFTFLLVACGKWAGAQDGMVPGFGSSIWIQKNKTADTRINVKTPFVDIFKSFALWKPHFNLSIGIGIISYNVLLDDQIGVDSTQKLTFTAKNTNDIKKYKLNTTYLELPVELNYTQDPDKHKTTFKVAVGIKVFYLVSSHTKTKYYSSAPQSKSKEYNIPYLTDFAFGPELRLAYGRLGLLANYHLNDLFDIAHSSEIHQALVALYWDLTSKKNKFKIPDLPFKPKHDQSAFAKPGNELPN